MEIGDRVWEHLIQRRDLENKKYNAEPCCCTSITSLLQSPHYCEPLEHQSGKHCKGKNIEYFCFNFSYMHDIVKIKTGIYPEFIPPSMIRFSVTEPVLFEMKLKKTAPLHSSRSKVGQTMSEETSRVASEAQIVRAQEGECRQVIVNLLPFPVCL